MAMLIEKRHEFYEIDADDRFGKLLIWIVPDH